MMIIGGLQRLTLIDYPKQIACTVFLRGCNFRCPWCYSPELVVPDFFAEQKTLPEDDFFRFLDSRKGKIDAVVICGGEPTTSVGLFSFARKIKNKGFLVKIDSNGSDPEALELLIKKGLVDYIAVDIKHQLNEKEYHQATGVKIDVDKVKRSISVLLDSKIVDYEFRTTVVPGLHEKDDIESIANSIKGARRYFIQNFLPTKTIDTDFLKKGSFSKQEMHQFQQTAKKHVQFCQTR